MVRPSAQRLALLRAMLAEKGLGAPRASGLPLRADRSVAPLSFAQERLFFLEHYEPGTALYNDGMAVHVRGALDPELVRLALAEIVRRHEVLRTSLELGPNGPEQRIHDELDLPLWFADLRAGPDPRGEAERIAGEDARAPFALERAPLWRATLARTAEQEWLLSFAMHHIISDGASYGILFRELSGLYAALGAGGPPPLPELGVQFGDYCAWERATIGEERVAELLPFWERSLSGELPPLRWPAHGDGPTRRGALHPLRLPDGIQRELQPFARNERATSNHVLLASLFALLRHLNGERDLRIGVASSLRRRPELAPLIGFFVQTLALRLDLAGDPSFRELLTRVREASFEAARHDEVPFDRIVRALHGRPETPLIQVFFSYMKDSIAPPAFRTASASFAFVDPLVARFELSLVLHESARETAGYFEYDRGLFEPDFVAELARGYVRILSAALARPAARLSELAPLAPATGERSTP